MKIREWPLQERPRERMIREGEQALSSTELLAILLRTGKQGTSALMLAQMLLVRFGGIKGIRMATLRELVLLPGMGMAKAVCIQAGFELGCRLSQKKEEDKIELHTFEAVASLYKEEMRHKDRETLMALHLDTKKQLIAEEVVSIGTLNASLVHPREVFRKAIKNGAASIILLHNHPSGNPTPSQEDIKITQRLQVIGELLEIPLLDHLVFGGDKVQSALA